MPFGPVDANVDLVALEERVLARWRERGVPEEVSRLRKGSPPWVFYEGPPTANAKPGLHHVWPRAFKDLFIRFQTMRGHDVPRKGGWDCHGLPVEIEVEKELGISTKREIEAFGIDNFTRRCRESVQRYVQDFVNLTERSGVWIDTSDAYWTLDNDYIESVWWLLRQMWDAGLLYEGYRVSPYCARCGTVLSSHELGQPGAYQDVEDPSVYVRFPVEGRDFDLLVWTTTPWTLISNVAAVVGADVEYVRVAGDDGGRDLVMAAALAPEDATVVERLPGTALVGLRYRRPFDFLPIDDRAQRVVAADFVTTDEGTGIVHIAPAFGADDMEVAKVESLPVLNPVGPDGAFDDTVPPWTGEFVKAADPAIIADLAERGVLVREQPYRHSYPHCWRCGTPLIYWAKTSWFVRTSEHRGELLRENETIGWHPEYIKHGRFGDWLENNIDWALSRDRYWGTPLPVWRCPQGHDTCVSSRDELSQLAGRDLGLLDLHRPAVDDVVITCPQCHEEGRRLTPVLDAWFDSGSMPSAQHHYPFDNGDLFEARFPADFICEAIDQTRGWFYSLLAVNTLVFDHTPYRNVVCLGLLVDEHGLKMSKSKGNLIYPEEMFRKFGADALRWNFFSAGSPWTSRRVYDDGIRESTRKTLLTLWNVFKFFAEYADVDGWTPPHQPVEPIHVLDRWIMGELDRTITVVTDALESFDSLGGATRIAEFVDDLSNWYVRRSRPRFWKASDSAAHATLYRCLVVTSQLLAPYCPFVSDELWTVLVGNGSVHASDWPLASAAGSGINAATIADQALSSAMSTVRQLVVLGRAARTDAKVKVRQPLTRALLVYPGASLDDALRSEIAEELNVKQLEDVESLTGLLTWTVVPNFRALGPRLGPKVGDVKQALATADGTEVRRALEEQGWVEVAGERLTADDVEVRATRHEDFALAQEGPWAVALDLDVDDALRVEGVARELVRALNDLRKEHRLELSDRIRLRVGASGRVVDAIEAHGAWIAGEVLADELSLADGGPERVDIDGEPVSVELTKV